MNSRLIVLPSHPAIYEMRNDAVTVEDLRDRLLDLNEQAQTIQAIADAEKRDLVEDEVKKLDAVIAEFDQVEADIERRIRVADQAKKLATPQGRKTEPDSPTPQASATDPEPAQRRRAPATYNDSETRGKGGFRSFGDFALGVKSACRQNGYTDPRLIVNTPTAYGSEGVGADGGFAVPPDFRKEIMVMVNGEDSLLSLTDQMTSDSNTLVLPVDETTPWQTSGGIQAYWEGEGAQFSQSKPALQNNTIRLNKLTALVGVTEELLEDASAMDTYLRKKAPEKINFKVNDALINGNGAGMPLGLLKAPALVSVAKETSQAADTILAENLLKMWSRCYGPSRRRAAWLYNQDIEPALMSAAITIKNVAGSENVGGFPAFLPPGGLSSTPYATLFGRPMIPTQACQTLGDKGDLILADLKQYLTAVKTNGMRQEVSIHLWFDYDIVAFKFVLRIAGQPWLSAPITPKNSVNTLSPFVSLDERAAG